ncbi:hypothetical protein ET464_05070 [Paenibacillus protaetiae]|uniref:Uncharacterized protein n=1 Tax=Paenibacillus protaetiae TaxID=2509456 RepID=A0A4P6F630_9BACL|nr:hypothetical protein ET464_05070 [Paenibacillus protaetiae]
MARLYFRIIVQIAIIVITLMVSGCQINTDELLTQKDVINAFDQQGYHLVDHRQMPITFNGAESFGYKLGDEWIYIFIYKSSDELKKGVTEYNKMRKKSFAWIPGKVYEFNNVAIRI